LASLAFLSESYWNHYNALCKVQPARAETIGSGYREASKLRAPDGFPFKSPSGYSDGGVMKKRLRNRREDREIGPVTP